MMRWAILADIHGNVPALRAVLRDMQSLGVDGVVVAGDFTGGPQSSETIALLRSLDSWMIRGNREDYFIALDRGEAPRAWYESGQWASMRWIYESLPEEDVRYVAALPEQRVIAVAGADPVHVMHGSPRDANERLIPDRDPGVLDVFRRAGLLAPDAEPAPLETVLADVPESVVVCGHTHIPWKQRDDGRLALNPGSVGAPLNGDARAQYAVLSWEGGRWEVTHRAVAYDLSRVRRAYEESGYLAAGGAIALASLLGAETGHNVIGAFLSHVHKLAAEAGGKRHGEVPDTVWEAAIQSFDWPSPPGREPGAMA